MLFGIKNHRFIHIFHMLNMNVIMIANRCTGVRRVRRGLLEWGNKWKGCLGVRVGADMYILCVCMAGKIPYVMHGIEEWSEGKRMIMDG